MTYKISQYLQLLQNEGIVADYRITGEYNICHASYNSLDIKPSTLFICKGAHFKAEYLADSFNKGAVCYVADKKFDNDFDCIIVTDIKRATAVIADYYYDHAYKNFNLIGITGTKGKSTTTYFMRYILDEYQKEQNKPLSGVISSIDTFDGVENFESHLTTPEPLELHKHFANATQAGLDYMTMEVSSQALKYNRVRNVQFNIGCYLNIGYDHISDIEHPNFEDYFSSKLKLFSQSDIACVCLDGERISDVISAAKSAKKIITFSSNDESADIYGYNIKKSGSDTVFDVRTPDFESSFTLTIPGLFNVQNALAAIAICHALKIPKKDIYVGLMKARSDGRMEVYHNSDSKVIAIVDYAHNKMSFENLFDSVKKEFPNRHIYTVFGCPGNKAQNRRKDLGEVAGKNSKKIFLTEEDAGEEPIEKICTEIAEFVKAEGCDYEIEPDRGEAIRKAICTMPTPSVVLITGKGNETRQKRGTQYIPCPSDVEYTKKFLKEFDRQNNLDCAEKISKFKDNLPELKKMAKKKVVVKLGGSMMENEELFCGIFDDLSMLYSAGAEVVVVHGGGKSVSAMSERLNIQTVFQNGLRVTDEATAEVCEMVLSGTVNKKIVNGLVREGVKAVGISGKDSGLLHCTRRENIGLVGKVEDVNTDIIETLLSGGFMPIVSPVSADGDGNTLNVNADEAALAVAQGIGADSLVFITDVDGLLLDVNNDKTLVGDITVKKAYNLIDNGLVSGGMLPKIKSCISCIENGVQEVRIINGNIRYNLISSFISPDNIGTRISK